jgi:hypothetical protein
MQIGLLHVAWSAAPTGKATMTPSEDEDRLTTP